MQDTRNPEEPRGTPLSGLNLFNIPLSRGLDVTLGFIRIRHIMLTKVNVVMAATKSHGHILLTKISVATDATKINVKKLIRLKIDEMINIER